MFLSFMLCIIRFSLPLHALKDPIKGSKEKNNYEFQKCQSFVLLTELYHKGMQFEYLLIQWNGIWF